MRMYDNCGIVVGFAIEYNDMFFLCFHNKIVIILQGSWMGFFLIQREHLSTDEAGSERTPLLLQTPFQFLKHNKTPHINIS